MFLVKVGEVLSEIQNNEMARNLKKKEKKKKKGKKIPAVLHKKMISF